MEEEMNDGPTLQCWSTTIHCLVSPTLLVVTQDISNKNMRGQILREQFNFCLAKVYPFDKQRGSV